MTEKLQLFENPEFGNVRVVMSESGEPMFVANDVAKVLGYEKPQNAVLTHCKQGDALIWGDLYVPHSNGIGGTNMVIIGQSNLYRLIMRSKLPNAERFQDWVCEEVLPSIRKHGAYMTDSTLEKAILSPDFLIQIATNLKEEQQKRIALETEQKENAPKVLFAKAVETSESSCLIGELAKILKQNGVDMGQNRLFEWMRGNEFLCNRGESKNLPTQRAMDMGLFEIKKRNIQNPNGSVLITNTTKVTGKGQIYFVNKLLNLDMAV